MIKLTIEDNNELLKKYGLATALLNSADYLIGEFIRLEGNLNLADQNIINALMDDKTLGRKVPLFNMLTNNEELKRKLSQALKDRKILAHGVSAKQGDKDFLMIDKGMHPLTEEELDAVVTRTRSLIADILSEIQKKHKLVQ